MLIYVRSKDLRTSTFGEKYIRIEASTVQEVARRNPNEGIIVTLSREITEKTKGDRL